MSEATAAARPDITVLVCSYNRREDVCELIETVLRQRTDGEFTYELILVDNNSNDGTLAAADVYARARPEVVRYVFEPQQGKSYALHTGLKTARGELLFVVDSDQLLPSDYLQKVVRFFRGHPDISIAGGKVLPLWSVPPPAWLTERHWSAVAMSDYGEQPFVFDASRPVCLLAASFRRAQIESVGGFRMELGVSSDNIGSVEDADLIARMVRAGYKGAYVPDLELRHKAEPNRVTKRYHRRWHLGHGRFCALWRDPDLEGTGWKVAGVPAHLIRTAMKDLLLWLVSATTRRMDAFYYETRLRFFWGFLRQRTRERPVSGKPGSLGPVRSEL